MTIEELELESFRQIRRKVSDITDESSNDEIAGFVKGVIALERGLFMLAVERDRQRSSDE